MRRWGNHRELCVDKECKSRKVIRELIAKEREWKDMGRIRENAFIFL